MYVVNIHTVFYLFSHTYCTVMYYYTYVDNYFKFCLSLYLVMYSVDHCSVMEEISILITSNSLVLFSLSLVKYFLKGVCMAANHSL